MNFNLIDMYGAVKKYEISLKSEIINKFNCDR